MMPVQDENVGVAFALVAIAGASTGIGAAVVFFPSIVRLSSRRFLAGCLGFSAGVMCYVSFTEIFQKSVTAFEDAIGDSGQAFAFTTLTFFGGVALMLLLNSVISWLIQDHHHGRHHHEIFITETALTVNANDSPSKQDSLHDEASHHDMDDSEEEDLELGSQAKQHSHTSNIQNASKQLVIKHSFSDKQKVVPDGCKCLGEKDGLPLVVSVVDDSPKQRSSIEAEAAAELQKHDKEQDVVSDCGKKKRLAKMGMTTALAVALHNFPEGIATFVAALNDPKVGAVLAIAIAIHNIPEGLCIAPPIFYATGNRTRAFLWALLSGAAELVAAFFAWLVLSSSFTDTMYATLFGLVAGMMVIICTRELLPTAHVYDPDDTVVTYSFIAGMMFMALSLVLFVI